MVIAVNPLVNAINANIAISANSISASDNIKKAQESQAAAALCNTVVSVATEAALPAASENMGRMIWVDSLCDYRYSDGETWTQCYNSSYTCENSVWGWGLANCGVLGNNNTADKSSPVSVIGGIGDWCQVSAKDSQSGGIRKDGTIWMWGSAANGQLGINCLTNQSSPVPIAGGITNWCAISVGWDHGTAIRTNGEIWSWGDGTCGSLGDGTITNKSSPVSVIGGFTWCQVSAGNTFTIAIRNDGRLWAWGLGTCGRLGDGTTINKSSPVSVVGGFTDWCQVSAGNDYSLGVRTNGTVWAWGCNSSGTLGDGATVNRSSPGCIIGGYTDWCQVSAGYFSAAIRTNGTLWAWGCNSGGTLGDGCTVNRSSPVSVIGGYTDWCQVSAGRTHAAAVRANGTLWSWGCGCSGALGDCTTVNKSSPVSVVGIPTGWIYVSAGCNTTLAICSKYIRGVV